MSRPHVVLDLGAYPTSASRRNAAAARIAALASDNAVTVIAAADVVARMSAAEARARWIPTDDGTAAARTAAGEGAERVELWSDAPGLFTAEPGTVPDARLIRRLGYREAEEIAALGARVLDPGALQPLAAADVALELRNLDSPDAGVGTLVCRSEDDDPTVTAVRHRTDVALVSVSTVAMLGSSGFLARVFAPFEELGVSVDLVATSQSTISFTLDDVPGGVDGPQMSALVAHLEGLGEVALIHPCGVVSVIGRKIRAVLHELGPAMEVFQERPVHLVSDSAEDLNLSFVVDEEETAALVGRLHERLFPAHRSHPRFGASWSELALERVEPPAADAPWWRARREDLLATVEDGRARYVYHLPTVTARAVALRDGLPSVARIYYSMKANPHPGVLGAVADAGLGIECVSAAEVEHVRAALGDDATVLFTPNFCPVEEYGLAVDAGADVIVDGPAPLHAQPGLFAGLEIGLRIDPGHGRGHHDKVKTAGAQAKFGQPLNEIDPLVDAVERAGARVVGLHAHVGSGIFDPSAWEATGMALATLLDVFSDVVWFDLGGGMGVPERPGQPPLDLSAIEASLRRLRRRLPGIDLYVEPGRFLVSEAGVLLAPVTQVRGKGGATYVGMATGMNSLLRPALYGAWHAIHNLTRIDRPPAEHVHVVGPICETGDVLGRDRVLPVTEAGDVLLIENAGAYGAVMSSRYNMRDPAAELVFDG